jgi:hypothetical protein
VLTEPFAGVAVCLSLSVTDKTENTHSAFNLIGDVGLIDPFSCSVS